MLMLMLLLQGMYSYYETIKGKEFLTQKHQLSLKKGWNDVTVTYTNEIGSI